MTELRKDFYSLVLVMEKVPPKDLQALIMTSDEVNDKFEILKAVEKVNALQKLHLVEKTKANYNNNLQGKHFTLWGLAFKPNTDDIREAPTVAIH